MAVTIVDSLTDELVSAMELLIPQLSTSTPPPSPEQIARFLDQRDVFLFIFRPDTADQQGNYPILGMLTLATFEIPTGKRAWIEDVVVAQAARGQGAGAALVAAAVEHATKLGMRTVDLTSRPSREAANRLYQRCGFDLRETNVYRYAGK